MGIAEFRVVRLGVAEADERCVRRLVGEDMITLRCSEESNVCTVESGGGVSRWAIVDAFSTRERGRGARKVAI